jgi:hypothetical protein
MICRAWDAHQLDLQKNDKRQNCGDNNNIIWWWQFLQIVVVMQLK